MKITLATKRRKFLPAIQLEYKMARTRRQKKDLDEREHEIRNLGFKLAVGETVRLERERRNLTRPEFAALAAIPLKGLEVIESGGNWMLAHMEKVCDTLGIYHVELFVLCRKSEHYLPSRLEAMLSPMSEDGGGGDRIASRLRTPLISDGQSVHL
jgi:hypothetical protein